MRIIAATIFCMSAAHAGDSAFWGKTGCVLVPIQGKAWVAEVRCENYLTSMSDPDVSADLQVGGLTVQLFVEQHIDRVPDVFTVIPPEGFIADPPVMSLDEDAEGVARVLPYVGF